jgi:PAS domain S-box-containing protein
MNRWFQNRSILFKLLAGGIGTLLFTALLWFAVMVYFFGYSDRSDRIQTLADSIMIRMQSARVAEKNFIIRDLQKEEFFKTGGSPYLKEHRHHLLSAREEIMELIRLSSGGARKSAESLLRLVDEYNVLIYTMVAAYRERGFKDWGLLGQWRLAIHDFERSVAAMNRSDLQENLLQLRRHEKDYLLRGEGDYIEGIGHQLSRLRSRISEIRDPLAPKMLQELVSYETAFDKYMVIEEKIGRTDQEGLQLQFVRMATQMKPVIDRFLAEAHRGKHEARRDLLVGAVFIYVFGIGLGSVIFYLFARSISSTLVELKNAALIVGRGRFDTRIAIQSKDEIGIVADAFNKMTEDLNRVTVTKNYVDKIIRSMADMLIVTDPDLTIRTANPAALELLGYREEELAGRPLYRVFGESAGRDTLVRQIARQEYIRNIETIYAHKNGDEIPVMFSSSAMREENGSLQGIVCLAQDNTDRKKTEDALKKSQKELRLLSAKILSAQEDERKRVARELHDGIGQALSGIKFCVENGIRMFKEDSDSPPVNAVKAAVPIIQNTIEETRRIAAGLRPSSLDDLGIVETILWFCQQFRTIYSGICIESHVDIDESLLSDPMRTAVYRILQEAFNNVAKHSGADTIRLRLGRIEDEIELVIEDNGTGFTIEKDTLKEDTDRGFGLASMKERAELSGGRLDIESGHGKGTLIRALWPAIC